MCTILGLSVGYQGQSGTELTLCLLLTEVSNPFLHARSLLREVGKQNTKAAMTNDLLFAGTFFVCRLLFGPVVVYKTLRSRSSNRIVKWGGAGIQVVSLFWFYKIVQAGARKARAVKEARKTE
ncbi:hypothetical protein WJX81_007025 [Elliptochloris bilobata]|uniref:TLC domain-containing protein n=1 Tax=Elliptochloris bilobata TaxID=381761 RepID=A0AAW1QPN8_9CHLO